MTRRVYTPLALSVVLAMSLTILHPQAAWAQITVSSGGGGISSPVTTPDPLDFSGVTQFTSTVKVYQTSTHTGTHWLSVAEDGTNGTIKIGDAGYIGLGDGPYFSVINGSGMVGVSSFGLSFSNSGNSATGQNLWLIPAAATLQLGQNANGAAIAQTFKTCDGITGTDVAGCNHIEAAGRGTGIGAPGDYDIQTAKDLATGTTAQTLFDRHFYRGKAKAVTESSATTFVSISVPTTLTGAGGTINYCIHANDATDVQERCGEEDFAVVNKAGTVTCSTPNILGTEAVAVSTGTLTNTFTFVANGTSCDMKANAVSSLTQTVLDVRYAIEMHGSGLVVP